MQKRAYAPISQFKAHFSDPNKNTRYWLSEGVFIELDNRNIG
jgi:hypothetical protein